MDLNRRLRALKELGIKLKELSSTLDTDNSLLDQDLSSLLGAVQAANPWFTRSSVATAMNAWSIALRAESVERWTAAYPELNSFNGSKSVGVINAGNIPFVGLHDLISVFLSGHRYIGKNASDDQLLLPWIVSMLEAIDPDTGTYFKFVDKISGIDAAIATGSDNSARYFEYYFGKYPNIIRRNRNGVAVLFGDEDADVLNRIGTDIFTYYGLGCRNVSKIYLPESYDIAPFFESMYPFHLVMEHHKYMNNFDYHHAVYLLKQLPFLQNNFLILKEDERIASPLAVLHYERYKDETTMKESLRSKSDELQCVVVSPSRIGTLRQEIPELPWVEAGQTQYPSLSDYADGVDTVRFLLSL